MGTTGVVENGALPIEEAVRFSGIGRTTLYSLIRDGRIRTVKIGKRRLVPRAELQRFLAEKLTPPRAAD